MDERQVAQLLQTAVNQHNAGDLASAEAAYRRILAERPTNADALHLLGVLLGQRGQAELGLPLLQRAITLLPNEQPFHLHLGQTLAALHRHEEALAALQCALQMNPRDVDARHAAGASLFALKRPVEAIEQFRLAAELAPQDGVRMGNYGYALIHAGRHADAVPVLRRAVELAPNLGPVWMQLGEAVWRCQRYDEALPIARRAAQLAPNDVRAQVLLGNTLQTLAQFDEAADAYRRAMQLDPNLFDPPSNLALTLLKMGRAREALAMYEQVCARWPQSADAVANRSLALLTLGQYERGFADYEARWRTPVVGQYRFEQPRWNGSDPSGKTILLMNEQGLGDTIHFVRYAPLLAARGARVMVVCPPELRPVIETVAGVDRVVTEKLLQGEVVTLGDAPRWDSYAPLSSLPGLFKTTLGNVPADVPYVKADAQRVASWRQRLAGDANLKVGIVWAGTAQHINDRARSASLAAFAPLAGVAGVTFYSLQKGPPAAQASAPPTGMKLIAVGDELHDFGDTAALLEALDLLISVDTSIVHLAGALARPVWTLLAAGPDWRWLLDREDSPWYPTMRLFRQPQPGAWQPAMERVARELERLAAQHKEQA
jgi:tetratricopeptide (TPR) repeat protein/ADP-heptose:LPS heptosyltransferase